MDDAKAPITRPATTESMAITQREFERFQGYVDELSDDSIKAKERLDNLTPILIFLTVGLIATFAASAYYAQKTNERLDRLERINGIDEIGRRK